MTSFTAYMARVYAFYCHNGALLSLAYFYMNVANNIKHGGSNETNFRAQDGANTPLKQSTSNNKSSINKSSKETSNGYHKSRSVPWVRQHSPQS